MKNHKKKTEIDTAIFCSTSGFVAGEITSFFFHKGAQGNEKGEMKNLA